MKKNANLAIQSIAAETFTIEASFSADALGCALAFITLSNDERSTRYALTLDRAECMTLAATLLASATTAKSKEFGRCVLLDGHEFFFSKKRDSFVTFISDFGKGTKREQAHGRVSTGEACEVCTVLTAAAAAIGSAQTGTRSAISIKR
jgi:hypothetical protein